MQKFWAAITLTAVAFSLAACSSSPQALAPFDGLSAACDHYTSTSELDQVKVVDTATKVPQLQFSAGLKPSKILTRMVKEGTGPVFTGNQYVSFDYLSYSTGSVSGSKVVNPQLVGASKFDGKSFGQAEIDSVSTADFCHALSGVREGSRVLVATPASNGAPDAVYLLDIRQIFLPHANGAVQQPTSGFPQVVRDPKTGQPGILAPVEAAPADFKKATVIQGAGSQVKLGDTVMANYEVFIYSSTIKDPADSNWTTTPVTPLPFKVTYGTGLIAGFVKSLEGSHVGDQIISIVPPALGYPEGRGSIPAGSTLIFVIDVLGIVK